jgi:diguanylate cyclase (GGDEF)-like protein
MTPAGGSVSSGVVNRAGTRTAALSAVLAVASTIVLAQLDLSPLHREDIRLSWWSIAGISIAAELMVFHVEFRKEVYSFTFSEIPLVLGLFFATPLQLVFGRLLGEALFLIVKERQVIKKLTLNLASFLAECVALLAVYQLLANKLSIEHPRSWGPALIAVCAADLLGCIVIAKAVRWHGGPVRLRPILAIGALTAIVNTSLALVGGVLLEVEPWAALLLVGIAVFLVVSYRSYAALTQRYESLSMLYDFTRLVSGAQTPDVVLEAILVQARDLLRAERAEIWLVDDRGGCIALMVDDSGRRERSLPADAAAQIASWFAMAPGTTLWKKDRHGAQRDVVRALAADDCIVAPVTEGGIVVGLLAVVNRLGGSGFRNQEAPMFATLANQASVALENGRLIDRLNEQARQREYEASHDALTGLPNRVQFGRQLEDRVANLGLDCRSVAVALMDLDGFKDINDTLGHKSGDKVLIEAAARVRNIIDPAIIVARLGGDEFALLFPDTYARQDLERCGRTIRSELARPMFVDGVRINLGISIGLAQAPTDGRDAASLLQRADVAMYGAKSGLGDGVNFYRVEEDTNSHRRLTLANDLSSALEHGELTVVYQPKVRFDDGEVVGFECLARWNHPRFGSVPPDEFIPLAERTGLIREITDFVLATALTQVRDWREDGTSWGVSVNLSMRNLLDSSLVRQMTSLFTTLGVAPAMLTLEITESNVMADAGRTIALLEDLAKVGVRLSVDDFGTGYSSLSYLQRLPVHEIKIDKTFVLAMASDGGTAAIVRSIIDLARNMNLKVVAEGIENERTWTRLRELGCDEGQGYFLSRPVPTSDIARAVTNIECLGRQLLGEPAPVEVS